MARKVELRAFVSVTSINPPRFYLFGELDVVVARKLYDPTAPATDMCVHDTHVYGKDHNCSESCVVGINGWPKDGDFNKPARRVPPIFPTQMNMSTYTALAALPDNTTAVLLRRVHDVLSKLFYHPDTLAGLASNPIAQGIDASGASCFHYLRADMGLSEAFEPTIYEINTNGETSCEARGKRCPKYRSHRDLFRMLELDRPTRLPPAERAKWEQENAGGWLPITPPA